MKRTAGIVTLFVLFLVVEASAQSYDAVVAEGAGALIIVEDTMYIYGPGGPARGHVDLLPPGAEAYLYDPEGAYYRIIRSGEQAGPRFILRDHLARVKSSFWDAAHLASSGDFSPLSQRARPWASLNDTDRELLEQARGQADETRDRVKARSSEYVAELGGIVYSDLLVEDYVSQALREVTATTGFGQMRLLIVHLDDVAAHALGDGTIIITTGLLARTRNKDELMGVLAHEVAHVVMNHHQLQLIKNEEIVRRSEVKHAWTAGLLAVLAGVNAYLYADLGVENAGQRAANEAIIYIEAASKGFQDAAIRASASYSRELERSADAVASLWLKENGYNSAGVAAFLGHLIDLESSPYSTHEAPGDRIARLVSVGSADPNPPGSEAPSAAPSTQEELDLLEEKSDPDHDRAIAFLLSESAVLQIALLRDYEEGLRLVNRLIDAEAADARDFTLKARALRLTGGSVEDVHIALDQAEEKGAIPLTYLERAVIYVRERKTAEARQQLQSFVDVAADSPDSEQAIDWATSMMQRLR